MQKVGGMEMVASFMVGSVPTLYYIPDFISDGEQEQLLNTIYGAPVSKWKFLKNRRLQNWGGLVHEKGLLAQELPPWLTRITEKIFQESEIFPSAINHVLINEYLPNQGIMPHQDGPAYYPVVAILSLGSPVVMDFTPHPSLEQCIEELDNKDDGNISEKLPNNNQPFSIIMMPRSLLIFKDKAYSDYLHGIKDCAVQQIDEAVNISQITKNLGLIRSGAGPDRGSDANRIGFDKFIHRTATRISLTCRVVSKVHKSLFKF